MSRFDGIFRNLATQLIDNTFGTTATLRRQTSVYDVTTGDNVRTNTDTTVSISPPAPVRENRRPDNALVQVGDATCYVAAQGLSVVPNPVDDSLIWNDDTYQIVAVEPIVSGDQDAAYVLFLRR